MQYHIDHHTCWKDGKHWHRWRICDDKTGKVIIQSNSFHASRQEAQSEINDVLDFLEEWSRERVQWGGV